MLEAARETASAAESTGGSTHMVRLASIAANMHRKFTDLLDADSVEGSPSRAAGRADAC